MYPPRKRDYEDSSKGYARLEAVLKGMAWCLRPLTRIGFVRRHLGKSFGGRVGAVSRYALRGEHDKAADLAIEALAEYRLQSPGTHFVSGVDFWWFFMRLATRSLEQSGDPEKWDQVIELAKNGPEPLKGYDVACSFLAMARWKYQQRDFDVATTFATTASKADATWPEPDFFMGWCCLALGRGDALAHLSLAVEKDPRILERIVEDTVCRQHPHIIEGLRKISSDDLNSGPEGPRATG